MQVVHINIINNGEYYSIGSDTKEGFATLTELLQFFSKSDPCTPKIKERHGNIIYLDRVFPCNDLCYQRYFHGDISGSEAEKLLTDFGKPGSYLVRHSQTTPGKLVLSVLRSDIAQGAVTHVYIRLQNGQYDIGGGPKFTDLNELISNYKNCSMVESNGSVLKLTNPINVTSMKALAFPKYVRTMLNLGDSLSTDSIHPFIHNQTTSPEPDVRCCQLKNGFSDEYECLRKLTSKDSSSRNEGEKSINSHKNRYRNILPFDHTRVILRPFNNHCPNKPYTMGDIENTNGDYINANYIAPDKYQIPDNLCAANASPGPDWYIATQGPLKNTVSHFWKMVWQENTRIIVMVTKEIEGSTVKCAKYWPNPGTVDTQGELLIQNITEYSIDSLVILKHDIMNSDSNIDISDDDIVRELYIYPLNKPEEGRKIYHFHCRSWPDHKIPKNPSKVLAFLKAVNAKKIEILVGINYKNKKVDNDLNIIHISNNGLNEYRSNFELGPMVVHCSAGIGRAGSYIALDMIFHNLQKHGLDTDIDIQNTVYWMRLQRSGMVQTLQQYTFIYTALKSYIEETYLK
ncbi:tyrosine-protein phosphatase non-receptor type 11-like isoform X2 [Gordionus sp. m RMFG-2023]